MIQYDNAYVKEQTICDQDINMQANGNTLAKKKMYVKGCDYKNTLQLFRNI